MDEKQDKSKREKSELVKITKGSVSIFRKDIELQKYLDDGWKVDRE
jgi:hypothetical protein